VRAKDGFGTQSPELSVSWDQTIRPPPLRQRTDVLLCSCDSDTSCSRHYALGQGLCPAATQHAAGVTKIAQKVGLAYVDNPNPVSVEFMFEGHLQMAGSRGKRWTSQMLSDPSDVTRGCDGTGLAPQLASGACYTPKDSGEVIENLAASPADLVIASYDVAGATYVGVGPSGNPVYRIPPQSTATVTVLSKPWRWISPEGPADYTSYGTLSNVTGWEETRYRFCTRVLTDPDGNLVRCNDQIERGALLQWTRANVQAVVTGTVANRVDNGTAPTDGASFANPTGTDLSNLGWSAVNWSGMAPGF
jgi:hypothetical protein